MSEPDSNPAEKLLAELGRLRQKLDEAHKLRRELSEQIVRQSSATQDPSPPMTAALAEQAKVRASIQKVEADIAMCEEDLARLSTSLQRNSADATAPLNPVAATSPNKRAAFPASPASQS